MAPNRRRQSVSVATCRRRKVSAVHVAGSECALPPAVPPQVPAKRAHLQQLLQRQQHQREAAGVHLQQQEGRCRQARDPATEQASDDWQSPACTSNAELPLPRPLRPRCCSASAAQLQLLQPPTRLATAMSRVTMSFSSSISFQGATTPALFCTSRNSNSAYPACTCGQRRKNACGEPGACAVQRGFVHLAAPARSSHNTREPLAAAAAAARPTPLAHRQHAGAQVVNAKFSLAAVGQVALEQGVRRGRQAQDGVRGGADAAGGQGRAPPSAAVLGRASGVHPTPAAPGLPLACGK